MHVTIASYKQQYQHYHSTRMTPANTSFNVTHAPEKLPIKPGQIEYSSPKSTKGDRF